MQPENTPQFSKNKWLLCTLLALAIFFVGYGTAFLRHSTVIKNAPKLTYLRVAGSTTTYEYVHPLLGCGVGQSPLSDEFIPLQNSLQSIIAAEKAAGNIATTSVYFDTRDGRTLSINADEKYYPASLMKVPTLISYYKYAEDHPEILSKIITYPKSSKNLNGVQYFKPAVTMTPGTTYTVDELLRRMVEYSDNNTVPLLVNASTNNFLLTIFHDLGVALPNQPNQDFMTVRTYANFFRILYNGTYLSWDMSEKALKILTTHDFPQGIEAGVPAGVPVSQKFGEMDLESNPAVPTNAVKELHDCGIVYYPDHPYLLCVMTKGGDLDKLANVIQEISKATYGFANTLNGT